MSRQIYLLGQSHNIEINVNSLNERVIQFTDSIIGMDKVLVNGIYIGSKNTKTPAFRDQLFYGRMVESYITLAGYNNEQYNSRFPITLMWDDTFTVNNFNIYYLKPKLISIRNSFIEFPDIANWNPINVPTSICITFFYEKYDPAIHQLNDWGELIEKK